MAQVETWYTQDLKQPVKVRMLPGNVFSQDNQGNLIGVHVLDNKNPAVLSGTVSGNVIRADRGTVAVTGTLSGSDCYIILPEAAYAIPGPISIVIKLTTGTNVTTLCAVIAHVYESSTDSAVDPGTIMPSIESLLSEIENAVASIPAAGFANGSALNTNIFGVTDFENGAIDQTTGQNTSSSARIRSKIYMPTTAMKYYSSNSNIRFMLYAYDKLGQYVGALQSNGSFGTNASSFAELDMSVFYTNPNYSGYKYRVVLRLINGDIQVDNVSGIYIDSYVLAVPKNTTDIVKNAENVNKLFDIDAGENISRLYDINAPILWEMGAISYATGENSASTTRGRSKYFIPTNADRISFGTYKTIRGFFLYAYNLDGTYIGAYKKSTGTFVTDGSETGFNTENTYFDIGHFIRQYPTYRFRIAVYARNGGADVSSSEFGSWIITNGLNDSGEKVKVIQYNIGKFNYGVSGGLSTNIAEKIANYREFLARENVDFLFLQEYVQYIDSGAQYAADDILFTPLFFEKSYSERETVIFGQRKMDSTRFTYLHTTGDNPAQVIVGETTIAGRTIAIASGVLNSSAPEGIDHEEQGIRALTKLTDTVLANYDYAIIGMDCNCISQEEAADFLAFMKSKGYRSGNWDYLGYKDTYNLSSSMYHAIDNVFVKGDMRIVNFSVPDVYSDLSSDHFPVIAEIRIK